MQKHLFEGKTVVITGGTGSVGKVLTRRLLSGRHGTPRKIIIFSRDEAKQYNMRLAYQHKRNVTDEVIYHNFDQLVEFRIGDIRDDRSVASALIGADIVVNAAALKQVPSCEYFPFEAVQTNIIGAENIVRAIRENNLNVETVVGVSTDKACKPINVMGMTKALQERIFTSANLTTPGTRFICVRYGNVLASRGSVIPLFHEQIKSGGPVTVTTKEMTRFLLPLERAVDTIIAAIEGAHPGETYLPKVASARILDVATALIGDRPIPITFVGIRPGEKTYESLVSEEEGARMYERGDFYVIQPLLPELAKKPAGQQPIGREYTSADALMTAEDIARLLRENRLTVGQLEPDGDEELLR